MLRDAIKFIAQMVFSVSRSPTSDSPNPIVIVEQPSSNVSCHKSESQTKNSYFSLSGVALKSSVFSSVFSFHFVFRFGHNVDSEMYVFSVCRCFCTHSIHLSRFILSFVRSYSFIHSISLAGVLCFSLFSCFCFCFLRGCRVFRLMSVGFKCVWCVVRTKLDCQLSWWMWWWAERGHATVCQHCHTVQADR